LSSRHKKVKVVSPSSKSKGIPETGLDGFDSGGYESSSWAASVGSKVYGRKKGHWPKGPACHASHPQIDLGGGVFCGASCLHPLKGYDIYVGLDYGMERTIQYPWDPVVESKVIEVYFPIPDGGIPKSVEQFKKMAVWLKEQLALGKRVHVGCIGGHGRTGLLLAALVSLVHDNSEAGTWVREHYCKSAIETTKQVQFLKDHFGITEVEASKGDWGMEVVSSGYSSAQYPSSSKDDNVRVYAPISGRSIWTSRVEDCT
jgi:hypothetical protein